ncbi:MAG: hypothetical protein AB7S93_16820 [Xanthobacteraceae bacterium]
MIDHMGFRVRDLAAARRFYARDRAAVDRFYRAAVAAGGIDNGPPGMRGPAEMKYYAAFALDPDGNNIEAGVRE